MLDALLEDGRFDFDGLSGSSAGAINAALLAEGWRKGGAPGAREALSAFWGALGKLVPFELLTQGQGAHIGLSAASRMMMQWASHFSPAQLNPLDLNALRDLLVAQIDFEALRRNSPFKLFIAATHANSGRLRIFREHEVSVEVLLASSCLPQVHHTVTIDGEPYWDGAYSANPAVFPLFYECRASDVLLVLLSPLRHASTPSSREEIEQRSKELAFSAHFLREMRMFVQATEFSRFSWWPAGRLERRLHAMRFHMIDTQDLESMQRTETKLIAHQPFLALLREQGRVRAQGWLAAHGNHVGLAATVDLKKWFE